MGFMIFLLIGIFKYNPMKNEISNGQFQEEGLPALGGVSAIGRR
jgi:hypothetical protein